MSAKQEEEALKEFFASALTPEEKDDTLDKEDTPDDNIGIIQGLKVKLMKHQIEGLEFLQDHEFTTDTKDKGKGKYGGILADDVIIPLSATLNIPRWVWERPFKH
jgi:SNF2 family DNA or RNA helicase